MAFLAIIAAVAVVGCTPAVRSPQRLEAHVARVSWSVNATCRIQGSAVYLGNGSFVTAAHVLDRNPDGFRDCHLDPGRALEVSPTFIDFLGRRLVAERVAEAEDGAAGAAKYLTGGDAAVLRVAPDLLPQTAGLSILPLCDNGPYAPTSALVVTINGAWRATARMFPQSGLFGNVDYLARYTDSGGAVIDLNRRCLLGVLSHVWPWTTPNSTNFTSVATIRRALGE